MTSTAARYRCVHCAEELPPIDSNELHRCYGSSQQPPIMDRVAALEARVRALESASKIPRDPNGK